MVTIQGRIWDCCNIQDEPLTIITKRSILDVAAALDPPLLFQKEDPWKKWCYSVNGKGDTYNDNYPYFALYAKEL